MCPLFPPGRASRNVRHFVERLGRTSFSLETAERCGTTKCLGRFEIISFTPICPLKPTGFAPEKFSEKVDLWRIRELAGEAPVRLAGSPADE